MDIGHDAYCLSQGFFNIFIAVIILMIAAGIFILTATFVGIVLDVVNPHHPMRWDIYGAITFWVLFILGGWIIGCNVQALCLFIPCI